MLRRIAVVVCHFDRTNIGYATFNIPCHYARNRYTGRKISLSMEPACLRFSCFAHPMN